MLSQLHFSQSQQYHLNCGSQRKHHSWRQNNGVINYWMVSLSTGVTSEFQQSNLLSLGCWRQWQYWKRDLQLHAYLCRLDVWTHRSSSSEVQQITRFLAVVPRLSQTYLAPPALPLLSFFIFFTIKAYFFDVGFNTVAAVPETPGWRRTWHTDVGINVEHVVRCKQRKYSTLNTTDGHSNCYTNHVYATEMVMLKKCNQMERVSFCCFQKFCHISIRDILETKHIQWQLMNKKIHRWNTPTILLYMQFCHDAYEA